MASGPAATADEIAESIRQMIDRLADAKFTQEMTRRGQDVAEVIAERGAEVGDRASHAWRDSRPLRRDAAKRMARATDEAARWSDRTWRRSLRPALRDMWKRRKMAISAAGAAGAAVPQIVDDAAVRIGLREREERHWGSFFFGLILGILGGAIVAMLLAPKRGSEMRHEIGVRADEVRREIGDRVDEIATKAQSEWVPMFDRNGLPTDGGATEAANALPDATAAVQEAAAEAGSTTGQVAEQAGDETADAINDAYDTVDRETRP
jgi:gas vesicle protein